jgi:cell division transport system ATP-binding protein
MIRFENLSYSYPNKTGGLRDINLTIEKGSFVCIYAPSAEFKTTLLNLIYGEVLPSSGKLYVLDYTFPEDRKKISRLRKKIGYAFHPFCFFNDLTVRKNLIVNLLIKQTERHLKHIESIVDETIQSLTKLNPLELVKNLSYSEKQILNIVRALIGDPLVLLLDDPFKHLDKEEIEKWMKLFVEKSRSGITVVATVSNPAIPQLYGIKAFFMKKGRLLEKDEK